MEEEPEEIREEEAPIEGGGEEVAYEEPAPHEEEAAPPEEPLVSPAAVPVTLKVELGQIEMGADKLLTLTPGNLLELHTQPSSPIRLLVNGRPIGKGELVMMGETLGVRITELGK